MKLTREWYIPQKSTPVEDDKSESVAYIYTDVRDRPCAAGFGGKRAKPDWRYAFRSEEQRNQHIQDYFKTQRERAEYKAQQAAARKAEVTELKVGDILHYSWGYEQTNAQFYQVVEVKPSRKSVVLREIAREMVPGEGLSPMAGRSTPIKDKFIGAPFLKRAKKNHVSMDYSTASRWDGHPVYVSWYG